MTEVRYGVTRTGGWGAWVIRLACRSPVNHAYLERDGVIIEAEPGGMRKGSSSQYPGAVYSAPITGDQADQAWDWSVAHIGTGYGWLDLLAIALHLLRTPTPRWAMNRLMNTGTLICSQSVALAYEAAGIHLGDKAAALTTPGDLLQILHHEPESEYW